MSICRSVFNRLVRIMLPLMLVAIAGTPVHRLLADDCPDAWITAKVKTRILADGINALKINIDTEECVVSLHGCVKTAADRQNANKIARSIKKVRAVKSELKICPKKDDG